MACDLPTPWDLKGSILSIPSDPAQCLRPSSHQLRSRVGGLSKAPRGLKGMRMWKVWSFAISSFVHLAFLGGWTPILKMATGTIQKSKTGEPRRLVKYCQRITIRPLFRTTVDSTVCRPHQYQLKYRSPTETPKRKIGTVYLHGLQINQISWYKHPCSHRRTNVFCSDFGPSLAPARPQQT